MSAPAPARRRQRRLRLPIRRHTVRLRLTLLYGGLFALSGAGLLAITYLLVATRFPGRYVTTGRTATDVRVDGPGITSALPTSVPGAPPHAPDDATDLHQLLIQSGTALALMTVAALGLGWLIAGRILRPLRAMTTTTRRISEDNLHRRLAVRGPRDELTDLGDTIDGLLARLETAFDAQRRFVANASHELRTPLTVERALLEVALADPDATAESLRATCRDVLAANGEQERLIEALLTLARSQQGLHHREPVDLAATATDVLRRRGPGAPDRSPRISATLRPAPIAGDPRLAERLVTNLVDNAVRYNLPDGRVEVTTTTSADRAVLTVVNTGLPVPADQVERLLQPFQRLAVDRAGEHDGLGLGLSIVTAIAAAHGGDVTARPAPGGGLHVEVTFPARGH